MYWFWGSSSATATPTAAAPTYATPTSSKAAIQTPNAAAIPSQQGSQSVIAVPLMPSQSPIEETAASTLPLPTASQQGPPAAPPPRPPQHHNHSLVSLIDSLINYAPMPKLMEAAVLVGKAKLLLESAEEHRLLDQTRMVDESLEEAIQHRNERNRLLKVAAERDALIELVRKHKLISFTPSLTEERTAKVDHIVVTIRKWIDVRGGLALVVSSSALLCNELRGMLLKGAAQVEQEIGTVFATTPPQVALPLPTLSYILLSALMIDVSRIAMTALTTFITDFEPEEDIAQLLGNSVLGGKGQDPQQDTSGTNQRKTPSSPGLGASFASAGTKQAQPLTPARANKLFFRNTSKGRQMARDFRELLAIAKATAASGNVREEVQTVASFKLAEIMSALDDTVPMEGVGRSKGERGRSPSVATNVTNGSFSTTTTAVGTPSTSPSHQTDQSKFPPELAICCLTGISFDPRSFTQNSALQLAVDQESLLSAIATGSGAFVHPFAAKYLSAIIDPA